MISLSSIIFDPLGAVSFNEDEDGSDFGKKSRRGNRIATLDGGSVTQDRGYSVTDLTFKITAEIYEEEIFKRISLLLENNTLTRISCREGVFIGIIKDLSDKSKSFSFFVSDYG